MAGEKIIARVARRSGGRLLDKAINRFVPKPDPNAKRTLLGGLAGAIATRVATRSVPGAIVVGSAVLAKRLYDRRHGKKAAAPGGKDGQKADPKA